MGPVPLLTGRLKNQRVIHCHCRRWRDLQPAHLPVPPNLVVYLPLQETQLNDTVLVSGWMLGLFELVHGVASDISLVAQCLLTHVSIFVLLQDSLYGDMLRFVGGLGRVWPREDVIRPLNATLGPLLLLLHLLEHGLHSAILVERHAYLGCIGDLDLLVPLGQLLLLHLFLRLLHELFEKLFCVLFAFLSEVFPDELIQSPLCLTCVLDLA